MQGSFPYFNIDVPREREEETINFLYSLGIEKLAYKDLSNKYDIMKERDRVSIECFLGDRSLLNDQKAKITERFLFLGIKSDLKVLYKQDEDWENACKHSFSPIKLDNGFLILPYFNKDTIANRNDNLKTVYIEPGMAFGTGNHFTTRSLCFLLMQLDLIDGNYVIDLGSGSCLLSIMASKLKAPFVLSIEKDPLSLKNAITNLFINEEHDNILLLKADILNLPLKSNAVHKYLMNIDFNIISEFLYRERSNIPIDALLLLSGIVSSEKQDLEEIIQKSGFQLRSIISNGEWVSFCIKKR